MNLLTDFNRALFYETYIKELGEYTSLHQLHYKKFSFSPEEKSKISQYSPMKILVLTEAWCGDSLALMPVLQKISEVNENWQLKVLHRDSNPELMNKFLTHGMRAIPVFLFLDADGELLLRWGPRPKSAAYIFESHRQQLQQGKIQKQDILKKIRTFYAHDRGRSTLLELIDLFEKNIPIEKCAC